MTDEDRIQKYVLSIFYSTAHKTLESDLPFPQFRVGEMVLWDYEETKLAEEVGTIIHRFHRDGKVYETEVWLKAFEAP